MEKNELEHDLFIVWKPEYNLGIPIIDEQHRGIVSTINSLHYCMQNDQGKQMLSPIIEMMNNYTLVHFKTEEKFLEKIALPDAEKHRKLHRDLSSKLEDTGRSSLLDKDPYKFMDFLKKWWISHICNEDLIYKNLLQGKA